MLCSIFRRRALDRISSSVMAGVSSIQMGAWLRIPAARPRRTNSSSCSFPLRSLWASTRPSDVRRRCTSCSLLISSEKNATGTLRSEEHTSELQSQFHLVCRLLLEKKKKKKNKKKIIKKKKKITKIHE